VEHKYSLSKSLWNYRNSQDLKLSWLCILFFLFIAIGLLKSIDICVTSFGSFLLSFGWQYISGTIMFDETLFQSSRAGVPFVEVLKQQGILPGIKVDTGLQPIDGTDGETATQGLDGLADRCKRYRTQTLISILLWKIRVNSC